MRWGDCEDWDELWDRGDGIRWDFSAVSTAKSDDLRIGGRRYSRWGNQTQRYHRYQSRRWGMLRWGTLLWGRRRALWWGKRSRWSCQTWSIKSKCVWWYREKLLALQLWGAVQVKSCRRMMQENKHGGWCSACPLLFISIVARSGYTFCLFCNELVTANPTLTTHTQTDSIFRQLSPSAGSQEERR